MLPQDPGSQVGVPHIVVGVLDQMHSQAAGRLPVHGPLIHGPALVLKRPAQGAGRCDGGDHHLQRRARAGRMGQVKGTADATSRVPTERLNAQAGRGPGSEALQGDEYPLLETGLRAGEARTSA